MRTYELKPTEENIKNAYLNDSIDRNIDVHRFISILNIVEGNCSIALDGRWGSGKTFFVKQVKLIMDALNNFIDYSNKDEIEKIRLYWNQYNQHKLKKMDLLEMQPQVSVYYDSWSNDNDEDPIISLIYGILQSVESDFSFNKDSKCLKIAGNIFEFFTGKKVNTLLDALKKEDPLSKLKENKDIHSLVNEFFESLLIEKGNRLVIFIDELDRCKPSYAVQLLERIKHYVTNDKISFVFSINVDELQHTIKQYYGDEFNSCKYLDRFFDLRISLPPANLQKFYNSINFSNSSNKYDIVSHKVIETYHFELREITKYLTMTKIAAYEATHGNKYSFDFSNEKAVQFCLICIVPIMIGLKIDNTTQYLDFIHGKDKSPLIEILDNKEIGYSMCYSLLKDKEVYEESEYNKNVVQLADKLNLVYNAIFVEKYINRTYEINIGKLSFDKNISDLLIRVVCLLSNYADFSI